MLLEDDLHTQPDVATAPLPSPAPIVPTIPEPSSYRIKNKVLGPPLRPHVGCPNRLRGTLELVSDRSRTVAKFPAR